MRRICWQWLIFAVLAASGCGQKPAPVVDLASERQRMVREQLMPRGVHDKRVLAAISKVPREELCLRPARGQLHRSAKLIGYGQTIFATVHRRLFMTEQLHLSSGDRVLEIGTGLDIRRRFWRNWLRKFTQLKLSSRSQNRRGYSSASWLQKCARESWRRLQRWPEHAPFDAIAVTCAPITCQNR